MSYSSKAVLAMIGVTVACSQSAAQSSASKSSASPTATPPTVNVCDGQIITKAEAAEVVGGAITKMAPMPGLAQSCEFKSAGSASLRVALRPGFGTATVQAWLSGKMSTPATPLSGVGEHAAWVKDLNRVFATKSELLCDILGPWLPRGRRSR